MRSRRSTTCSTSSPSASTSSRCARTSRARSSALSGCVEAFEDELGIRAGRDDGRRQGHVPHGRVPRRLRLCNRRRGRQPLPPARQARRRPRDREGDRWPTRSVLLAGAYERDLTKLAEYQAIGGYAQRAEGAPAEAREADRGAARLEPARPRRRRFPDGPQGLADRPGEREAEVPRRQRRRVRAGRASRTARCSPACRTGCIEGCLIAAHAIECKHVFIYIRGEYLAEYEILERARRRGAGRRLFGDVEITVYRGAGAYICGEETALLDSLEGRRGQPRPRPPFPPCAGALQRADADQQRLHDRHRAVGDRARAGEVREDRRRELAGHARSSRSPATSRSAGNYELELGTPMRELIYDHAGGIADGRELKAVIPGGSSVRRSVAGSDRRAARLRLARRDRHVLRRRLADRRRRPLLHGAARAAVDQVLHARVVRQMHAVPRGDALDGAASSTKLEAGRGSMDDIELLRSAAATASSASRLCALGDFAVYPVASYVAKWGEEFERHVELGRCPYDGESTLEGIVAPGDPRRMPTRTARCTRERRPREQLAAGSPVEKSFRCRYRQRGDRPRKFDLRVAGWLPHPGGGRAVGLFGHLLTVRRRHDRFGRAQARAGHAHDRRARRSPVPKGTGLVEAALGGRDRDSGLLLRAAARAAGRRLPDVPRRGAAGRRSCRPAAR